MTGRGMSGETSLEALLATGRPLPRQPDAVRQRVLARATEAAALAPTPLPRSESATRAPAFRHVAMAAGAALAVGIAGTVYALDGGGSRLEPAASTPVVAAPAARSTDASAPRMAASPGAPVPLPPAAASSRKEAAAAPDIERPSRRPRAGGAGDETYDAELGLMRSAHNAYASHEFANALVLVSEHARRFPRGLLAEEREALRVRCLLAAGRSAEAQRAAADFLRRFPRSVLVPRIEAEVRGSGD